MVAYSFKKRFIKPIEVGLSSVRLSFDPAPKTHTIRDDRKRHARPGEEVQLYYGMRTKHCELIGRAKCIDTQPIQIRFSRPHRPIDKVLIAGTDISPARAIYFHADLDLFAQSDGFDDFADMRQFWREEHDGSDYAGVIVRWRPL